MRMLVLAMLLSATLAPSVLADVKWEEDGWLATIGLEHLDNGDEFGCYGMPNLEWKADPGAVALECRNYIEDRIDASKWGAQPLSTYTPSDLTAAQHTVIANQGFTIHGDNTGQSSTAWHSSENVPESEYDWYDLGRRGGSLEKEIADVDALSAELDAGGLVNMYWIGRIHDATVRHDGDVLDMLSQRNDVWFTTWGEAYSYWSVHRCYEFDHQMNGSTLHFEHIDTIACRSSTNAWNVPVTWIADISGSNVTGSNLIEISTEESNTMEGWRQEGDILYFSVLMGHEIHFNLTEDVDYDILGRTQFFNNKSAALTVAGHSTTDLFLWSKRFDDNQFLRFTWLISPRSLDEGIPWLPYAGVGVLLASVSGIWLLLKKDSLDYSRAEELMPVVAGGDDDE
ncbi:MAG: hypothetical protein DWC06_06045 [Candidatus Poseidoniales archaeon]|nr:MAG: hypothetical protein DWC06_06045 [Candidatus Poseidoniales archaeon]